MTIESFPEDYHGVAGAPQAPGIFPNGVPGGASPADLAAAGLGLAGNAGVPGDMASSTEADLDRRARAADAARKFPANEADGAAQMQGVGGQQAGQMIQQVVSSITGAVGGAVGGILGPLTQLPQQAMQAGQSAMQPLMSALQQGGHGTEGLEAAEGARLADGLGGGTGGGAGGGAGGLGVGGPGGTTPTGYMGPPPVPSSSPPTSPAGAPSKSLTAMPTGGTPTTQSTGMTGMPMMPPGAMGGGGEGSKDKPPDKRVTVPGVPNGQPVKGRLTAPPSVPVTKSVDGKPVATKPTRRIVIMPPDDEAKD